MSERIKIVKTGYLWKQGGAYKSWKARYFVLKGNSLEYYKSEGDGSPKGTIDLTEARGVRTREQCSLMNWPDKARPGRSFGVAVENRTFYMYGEDITAVQDWMSTIQGTINKVGKPTTDCSGDVGNSQETKVSRVMRSSVRMMNQMAKKLTKHQDEESQSSEEAKRRHDSPTGSGSSVDELYDDIECIPVKTEGRSTVNQATAETRTSRTRGNTASEGVSHGSSDEIEEVYDLHVATGTSNTEQDHSSSELPEVYEVPVVTQTTSTGQNRNGYGLPEAYEVPVSSSVSGSNHSSYLLPEAYEVPVVTQTSSTDQRGRSSKNPKAYKMPLTKPRASSTGQQQPARPHTVEDDKLSDDDSEVEEIYEEN